MKLVQAIILLFLVLDPLGNIPVFLAILRGVEPKRRQLIIIRELIAALVILMFFLLFGTSLMGLLQISQPALSIAGGTILFMIAIKMVFPISEDGAPGTSGREPFIVPLAVPLVAGPSAMSTVLILVTREPAKLPQWLLALFCAWLASAIILLFSAPLSHLLGERGLNAIEKLMGMLLTVIAVQMFMTGLQQFLHLS